MKTYPKFYDMFLHIKFLFSINAFIFLILFTALNLFTNRPVQAGEFVWTTKSPMFTVRGQLGTATANNGKIYAIGGKNLVSDNMDTNEEYDPTTNTWTPRLNMPTGRKSLSVAFGSDGKIYAIGGYRNNTASNLVEAYDPITDTWITRASMSVARGGLGVVASPNGKIYAVGGHNDTSGGFRNTVEEYDPVSNTWTTRANLPTLRYFLGLAATPDGKIYAIGGFSPAGASLATVEEYNPGTNTWTTKSSMPTARGGVGVVFSDGKIYALGGSTSGDTDVNTSEVYDPQTDTWTALSPPMPTVRTQLGVTATANGNLYAIGGYNQSGALNIVEEASIKSNQPPTINAGGPYQVDEGGNVLVTAGGSDPENEPLTYAWDLDDNGSFETPGPDAVFSAVGLDDPEIRTITVQVTDSGDLSATDQATVEILNVAPTVDAITGPINPIMVNTNVYFSADFSDPGIADTHTAVWDWGDGGYDSGVVEETNGSGTASNNHQYSQPGLYSIKVEITDDDGGVGESVYQPLIVYDPQAGFVTGGGRLNSPAGAYTQDQSLSASANLGFNLKYQPNSSMPQGELEFQLQDTDLNFHAHVFDWLVVNQDQAVFQGAGTINHEGDYQFQAAIIDGGKKGTDFLSLKIWNLSGPVYEVQYADLTGGNLVIHHLQ